jgi:hypothetical protein
MAAGIHLLTLPLADLLFRVLQRHERRVESRAVWVTALVLLPMLLGSATLGGIPGLAGGQADARRGLLGWLAGVTSFTIVGYLLAEARSRSLLSWPRTAVVPAMAAAVLTVLADPTVPQRRVRLAGAVLAAVLGTLLFELQRAHVTALRIEAERGER